MSLRTTLAAARLELAAAVAVTLIVQATISLFAACVPVLAPAIADARGWNVGMITFYTPLLYLTAFLCSFQVPHLMSRLGGMGLSLVALAVGAAGLLTLLSESKLLLLAAPLAVGLAHGVMNPASTQILGPRTTARSAGFIMSVKQTGIPLGAMAAGAMAPLLAAACGWQNAIGILALAGASLTLVLLPTVRWLNGTGPTPSRPARISAPVRRLLALPGMPPLLIAGMSFAAMQLCLRTFFTVYLVDGLGFGLTAAGLAFSASQVAGMIGQVGWAAMSDRLVTPHAMTGALGLMMTLAAVLAAAFTPDWSFAAVIAVSVLLGASASGFLPVLLGEIVRQAPPGEAGTLTSGLNVVLFGAILVGPLVFGMLAIWFGYPVAFAVLSACTFACSLPLLAGRQALRTGA